MRRFVYERPVHHAGLICPRSVSSALLIARCAAAIAAALLPDVPDFLHVAISTDHFQKPRLMPWTIRYSTPRYSMASQATLARWNLRISAKRVRQYSRYIKLTSAHMIDPRSQIIDQIRNRYSFSNLLRVPGKLFRRQPGLFRRGQGRASRPRSGGRSRIWNRAIR
jgi:hypothetical protein